jgi:hypothetical protein
MEHAEHTKELEMELRKRYDTVAFAQYGTYKFSLKTRGRFFDDEKKRNV